MKQLRNSIAMVVLCSLFFSMGCAVRTPSFNERETVTTHTNTRTMTPPEIDQYLAKNWEKMAGGYSRYDGFDGSWYSFTLSSPETVPSDRDNRYGWRYGQFDDFFNALGIGEDYEECALIVKVLTKYFKDYGVTADISQKLTIITVSSESELYTKMEDTARNNYIGWVIVKNHNNTIEDILYAGPDINSKSWRGYIAKFKSIDHNADFYWGHAYWREDETVKVPADSSDSMNFPRDTETRVTKVIEREKEIIADPWEWCKENPLECTGRVILTGVILAAIVIASTPQPGDPSSKNPPAGGGQTGGGGTGGN